ncbi:MAG: lycopene cyclase family protein [Bacteroidota bacterium]
MQKYDYIIAGGGAAGLSLAYYLSLSKLSSRHVLIIDKDRKNRNDRTWGFWTKEKTAFDHLATLKYSQLNFYSKYYQSRIDLFPYRYRVIRGIDFYGFIKNHLEKYSNFHFLNERIEAYDDRESGAVVKTSSGEYEAGWVFSSIFDEEEIRQAMSSELYLKQHFKGYVIETGKKAFDPSAFTMFDFRTPQQGLMRFFYVLPHSETRALVEYTLFSEELLDRPLYDEAIRKYVDEVLKIGSYEIVEDEFGIIPMTNYVFPVTKGKHIIQTGSAGGSSKPSSGYTFMRIQRHVQEIVRALETGKSPVISANSPARYRFFDSVLLNILKHRGDLSEKIFSQLFKNNSIKTVFRFLDEKGGLPNDLKIIFSLPPGPFLKSTIDISVKSFS